MLSYILIPTPASYPDQRAEIWPKKIGVHHIHRYKGQLCVDRRICCCSQFMIFLLELLGQAIGCLAGPSSSNRKIMN